MTRSKLIVGLGYRPGSRAARINPGEEGTILIPDAAILAHLGAQRDAVVDVELFRQVQEKMGQGRSARKPETGGKGHLPFTAICVRCGRRHHGGCLRKVQRLSRQYVRRKAKP